MSPNMMSIMSKMSEIDNDLWLSKCFNYGVLALGQIAVVVFGMTIHADIRLSSPRLQQCFNAHSRAMSTFAIVMVLAELYASIIVTAVDGPFIIIPWLFIAQVFVTLLYLYLPFEYYDIEAEEDEKEKDLEPLLLPMEDDETLLGEDEYCYYPDCPCSLPTASSFDSDSTGYGTMEFSQLSGPGDSLPI